MARSERPASESYQSVSYSGSQSASLSGGAGLAGPEEDDDHAPIFSLSKSSMDVVTTTLHKPSRADMRRSSSTNTHSEPTSVMLQQLHPHMLQHISSTNSPPSALTTQNVDLHSPPVLSERWIANMQRWSGHSGSTHSRSSTPDTVVWKDGSSRPLSQTQETLCSAVPDSPMFKQTSPPATPSPLISPLQTPTLPPEDLLTSSSSLQSAHQEKDFALSSPSSSLLPSPLQASPAVNTSSPLPPSSSDLLQLTSTEDEGFLENNSLSFTFPSPIPSSVSLAEAAGSSDPGDVIKELQSPGGAAILEGGGERSPLQAFGSPKTNSPAAGQEPTREISVCRLQLPGQSGPTGRGWRSPLVSSLSDSQLRECCRCNLSAREGITKAAKVEMFREDGTMTSRVELVDAAVQTISPAGSLWGLRRETSASNMDAHSILGSPPGSRLNLKASVGSNSNLVSPSSSMFPVSSGEEEEKREEDLTWEVNSASTQHDAEGRRSCLKTHGEEKDEMGRRSSMKQVQWDEDGMTWDVHGASVDPEVLSSAIRKHLENQNSPQPLRRSSKKKKAPMPPLISNIMRATTPEPDPPESTSAVEGDSVETPEEDAGREAEEEAGGKKEEETVEATRRISRAEGENAKEEEAAYGEEGTSHPKSPSRGSGRKKSVIRSLRPGWCGSSRKTCD